MVTEKKTMMEQLREDFEAEVERCLENSKKLTCEYDDSSMHTKPWSCKVCTCKKGKFDDCKNIMPVKYILSVYPDKLDKQGNKCSLTLPPGIPIHGPHNKTNMEHISCGDKKDHTLKLTQLGAAKVIQFPKGVPLKIGDNINPGLWAKTVIGSATPWQMKDDLLRQFGFNDYVYHNEQPYQVFPIWKDDWSEEYEGAESWDGRSLTTGPPPTWGDVEALREWVSNADDVTPPEKKVDLRVDEHGNLVLEYDSTDERILSYKHLLCFGASEKLIEEKTSKHGMYGEGIKQANVILSRRNKWMKIEAVGSTFYPTWYFDNHKGVESWLPMVFRVPNKRKHGTKVTFLNIKEPEKLIENVKGIYLRWRKDYEVLYEDGNGNQIITPYNKDPAHTRCITINGQRSQIMESIRDTARPEGVRPYYFFNYNLNVSDDKEKETLWGRDRRTVDPNKLSYRIDNILGSLGDGHEEIISMIIDEYRKSETVPLDLSNLSWGDIHASNEETWTKVVLDKLQEEHITRDDFKKVAIKSSNDIKNQNLINLGFKLVNWGSGNWLLRNVGLSSATDDVAFPESLGTPVVIPLPNVDTLKNMIFHEAKDNLAFLLREYYHESDDYINMTVSDDNYDKKAGIAIAESFEGCDELRQETVIMGMYRGHTNKIYIHKDGLDTVEHATGILIHEWLHGKYHVGDSTREFENLFTSLSGHTGSRWAMIQTALEQEYQRTGEKLPWVPITVMSDITAEKGEKRRTSDFQEGDIVMITDIHPDDGYYPEKETYIGKKGKLIYDPDLIVSKEHKGWYIADIEYDDSPVTFSYVKLKRLEKELDLPIPKGEWVEITNIGHKDFYYPDRDEYIGRKGEIMELTEPRGDGWTTASIELEDTIAGKPALRVYIFDFVRIKPAEKEERLKCWRCENISAVTSNPVITPVFRIFPKYNSTTREFSKCGEGAALEWPYLLKPACDEGYDNSSPIRKL